ncbi:MAG: hypothetical protein OEZ39_11375 [Gammaproteobacteria bacterium]|nr:hypothetical protein [Gammaproteobacteria bacterium]MDH5652443.1 hypothetical protein [Gammaproteobacteria bacterium]
MDSQTRAYIAGTGIITALGLNTAMNALAVKAGVNRYASADYFTRKRERINMALVPNEALPPLVDELDIRGKISFRDKRLLRMCQTAAGEALADFKGKQPVPLILAAPANDFNLPDQLTGTFVSYLVQQSGLPIDPAKSRLNRTGRAGVLEALELAFRYLYEANEEYVLIGGMDSYQNSDLLEKLDADDRVTAPGVMNGFAPGEGAAFILLTRNPAQALRTKTHIPALLPPGLATEPGHLFSDEPYKGDGLDQAFKAALSHYQGPPITQVWSSMNGENYWAKEYGVAMGRSADRFNPDAVLHHPADCYGEVGAAVGGVLIALAVNAALQGQPGNSLIYCSSDQAWRAACVLESIPLTAFQQKQAPQAQQPQPKSIYGRKA